MTSVNYYRVQWDNFDSGGGIFDSKVSDALNKRSAVRDTPVAIKRAWGLPIWNRKTVRDTEDASRGLNVVSHECLHDLVDHMPVHSFIVHNYFPAFDFESLRLINPIYRVGSHRIFRKIFSASEQVLFLSSRERRLASASYPEFADKFLLTPPGSNSASAFFAGERSPEIIDVPGTVDWMPKKLSYRMNLGQGIPVFGRMAHGFEDDAYITILYDAFLSGFKLKLTEIAKHGKSLVSFCDVHDELESLGFADLPYTRVSNRNELRNAILEFRRRGDIDIDQRRQFFELGQKISWDSFADAVFT